MFVVVCYDVADDGRRAKVLQAMKGCGVRVQKSVFECLLDEGQRARMEEKLRRLCGAEDLARIYTICGDCQHKTVVIGEGKVTEDEPGYVV